MTMNKLAIFGLTITGLVLTLLYMTTLPPEDNRQVYRMTSPNAPVKVRILARYEGEDAFWVETCDGGVPFALNRGEFQPVFDTCP